MTETPDFPAPLRLNGRLTWDKHEYENYKRRLLGLPPLERDPDAPIVLVSANQIVADLPFGRRTLGKLVKGRFRDLPAGAAA
jgi:hypothetical protein